MKENFYSKSIRAITTLALAAAGSGCVRSVSTPDYDATTDSMRATLNAMETHLAELKTARASTQVPTETLEPIATATAESVILNQEVGVGLPEFQITGLPEKVDAINVLQANGPDAYGNNFVNMIGLGSQMMIAEPGTLLVGPDFNGDLTGHNEYISPINQVLFDEGEAHSVNCAEGAFVWATGATMTAEVDGITIHLEGQKNHNWFLIVRGLFADGKQDTDRNQTIKFTDFVPGHAQAMLYPAGAYISEGNFIQVAEKSHTDGRNCGNEGCSGLSVLMLDLNTKAYTVLHQEQLNADWKLVDTNWFNK